MYIEGNIIYFDPFYFKNAAEPKRKYFLVLKNIGDTAVLASLPSSQVHLPDFVKKNHGCTNLPESCISVYIFQQNIPITKCGWSFSLPTFLYANWLDDFDLTDLKSTYRIEKVDYEIIGQLTDAELQKIKECFRDSITIKRKYKKLLAN